jgi:hypothetical protein
MNAVLDFCNTEASVRFVLDRIRRDPNVAPSFKKNLKVCFEYGALDENGQYQPGNVDRMSRQDAAEELRFLRSRGAYIERRGCDYYVEIRTARRSGS